MSADPFPRDVEHIEFDPSKRKKYDPSELGPDEIFWRNHQKWLEESGYMLRPRYRPEWVPSWKKGDRNWSRHEDSKRPFAFNLLDATRKSDGEMVVLKKLYKSTSPLEIPISCYFSSEPLASHPRNHCVPVYDVLKVPDDEDLSLLVIPLLRHYDSPRFESVGEVVEFFRQVFEGLQFMHQCHVSHRDCMNLNIMMDPRPLFPDMFHPAAPILRLDLKELAKYYTRTARPAKYYLIDFGLSRKYDPQDGPPRAIPTLGGDKTAPELQNSTALYDPFPTDVYYLGNMIREDFLQQTHGVEFMELLVNDMVQDDPSKRPTMDQVVNRYAQILGTLSGWTLRSRLIYNDESGRSKKISLSIRHLLRTAIDIVALRSAIPTP